MSVTYTTTDPSNVYQQWNLYDNGQLQNVGNTNSYIVQGPQVGTGEYSLQTGKSDCGGSWSIAGSQIGNTQTGGIIGVVGGSAVIGTAGSTGFTALGFVLAGSVSYKCCL